ncbi:hypothetical protein M422DRAFT_265902 [Sphaerobolus stellatus SS14]|uniref:MULE transposase domain-containing protein n=1 Tax=Sphaerobolus stellatus (strain SS14) TaxID=990650 RepID=A0A0C9USP8_SPHS4|nr:hypothetical protein M422DRAFT_265902 [Sphaerobolus stellatus SS14]
MSSEAEIPKRFCSKSSCRKELPPVKDHKWKTCKMHLEDSRNRYLKKAAQSRTPVSQGQYITNNVAAPHQLPGDIQVPSTNNNGTGRPSKRTRIEGQENQENGQDTSCSETEKSRSKCVKNIEPLKSDSARDFFNSLKNAFVQNTDVEFDGCYEILSDPHISYQEHVKFIAEEVWKVTGYRWTCVVNDHTPLANGTGLSSRYHCCQDSSRKKKPKKAKGLKPGAKPRDNSGMDRFDCESYLHISISALKEPQKQKVHIRLNHHLCHVPYYEVTLPEEVQAEIRENIWAVPSAIASKIRSTHPNITSQQVYRAWATFSETLWRPDDNQLDSARQLLEELKAASEVDVFELEVAPGVTALGWGLKNIASRLKDQIVEVALDATYNTNAKDLELYCCMGEYDNAGFPLAYCLLTTASSITPGKRKITLTSFLEALKNSYNVNPRFVHTDKDIAEIKSAKTVWMSFKHQLCWWHIKKAVTNRLKNSKRSTTPYDPLVPKMEFDFIDLSFVPNVRADPNDVEDSEDVLTSSNPPPPVATPSVSTSAPLPSNSGPNVLHIKIKIPAGYQRPELPAESEIDSDDDVPDSGLRSFCPSIYQEKIIQMMERHLCAHPLIPGYSAPTKEGIRAWSVKEMYTFCVKYNLRAC